METTSSMKILYFISALSTIVTTFILLTFDSYGFIILMVLWWIILPILFLYKVSLAISIILFVKNGIKKFPKFLYINTIPLVIFAFLLIDHSAVFKGKLILRAALHDDLSYIELLLRDDYTFENSAIGMFGVIDTYKGKYILKKDTLILLDKAYSNDFIPDTLLIDIKENAVFFARHEGVFSKVKSFAGYYKIDSVDRNFLFPNENAK